MIDKRTDYKYITIPYGMKIEGKIFPKLEENDKRLLRGEDPAFLKEAAYRRYIAGRSATINPPIYQVMDKRILGSNFQGVIATLHGLTDLGPLASSKPLNPLSTWNRYYVYYDTQSAEYFNHDCPCILNPGSAINTYAMRSKQSDFDPGQPVERYKLSYIYQDFDRLRRFQLYYTQDYNWGYVVSYSTVGTDSKGVMRAPSWPYLYSLKTNVYSEKTSSGQYRDKWDVKRWTMSFGSFKYKLPTEKMAEISDTITVFLMFSVIRKFATDAQGGWRSRRDQYTFPVEARKAGTYYEITSSSVVQILQIIKTDSGLTDTWNPHPEGYSQDGMTGVYSADILINTSAGWSVCELNNSTKWD